MPAEQIRRDFEPTEPHWSYDRLKEALVAASGHPDRFQPGLVSFDRLPSSVDIGKFGDKALECVRATSTDGKERGLGIEFFPVDRRILIDRELIVGSESQVAVGYPKSIGLVYEQQARKLPGFKRVLLDGLSDRMRAENLDAAQQSRRLTEVYRLDTIDGKILRDVIPARIGNVHSHPRATPVSAFDLVTFLSTPELRFMSVGRSDGPVEFLMKTDETVALSEGQKQETSERWFTMMSERVQDGARRLGLGELEANQRAQTALARTIANKYKLGYYVGGNVQLLERVT